MDAKSQNLEAESARDHLIREYQTRCLRNPKYSLRAYARSMQVSHSLLSLIINGKRETSQKMIRSLSLQNLNSELEYLNLTENEFNKVSSWVHYAILNLVGISSFSPLPKFLAKTLNITPVQAASAWQDLLQAGLLKKKASKWVRTNKKLTYNNLTSTDTTRNFIRGFLAKANQSLDDDPFSERNLTTITFTMNEKYLPLAVERIKNFRRKLSKELESTENPERVYSLAIQLFPLSKKTIKNSNKGVSNE